MRDMKSVLNDDLQQNVTTIEECVSAIEGLEQGEIDVKMNEVSQQDSEVKPALLNKIKDGLVVDVTEYDRATCQGMEILYAPAGLVVGTTLAYTFDGCENLMYIDELHDSDGNTTLDSVVNIGYAFQDCWSLGALPSSIKFSGVTNGTYAFSNCYALTDVSGLDLSALQNASYMFSNCRNLTTFGTKTLPNLTSVSNLLYGCPKLAGELDVSGWNVSKCNSFNAMFYGLNHLTAIVGLSGWDVSNVTNTSYMFIQCSSVEELDVSSWDVSDVTKMSYMFATCSKLQSLDMSGWDMSNVTTASRMLNGCTALGSDDGKLTLGGGTGANKSFGAMFYGLSQNNTTNPITEIEGVDLSVASNSKNSDTGEYYILTNSNNSMYTMFANSKVTRCIFAGAHSLKFNMSLTTQGWQNLDAESIESLLGNCLYDWSEDTEYEYDHVITVTSAMYETLTTDEIEEGVTYADYLMLLGWDLQTK